MFRNEHNTCFYRNATTIFQLSLLILINSLDFSIMLKFNARFTRVTSYLRINEQKFRDTYVSYTRIIPT